MLDAFPENPQCSHSNHWRLCRYFQFHVSFPQLGHGSGCAGLAATHGVGIVPAKTRARG